MIIAYFFIIFKMKKFIIFLIPFLFLAGCGKSDINPITEPEPMGMANPASVYCEENGGVLEMREEEAGQYGVCVFPNGSECEEWAFYRGECEPSIDDAIQNQQIIGGDRDEHDCLISAGYSWCEVTQKCQRLWEEPCIEDSDFDVSDIEQAFLNKYPDWAKYNMKITVSKQIGDFASGGSVPRNEDAGGGYFFAAKTDDGWVIAADGNGNIVCSEIKPYDFPSDMISECWDDENMVLVER